MTTLKTYLETLRIQRWDDHRFYHHSRINQSLHLLSAVCFVVAYVLLFIDPASAALVAWGISMTTRQAGHFFFEPHDYDKVNQVTHDHKEEIKVGYNLRRKVVLMGLWAVTPAILLFSPSFFGILQPGEGLPGYLHSLGLVWLAIGIGGLLFRAVQLVFLKDWMTSVVWVGKILTDPFHDIMMYWRSPMALMRGEWMDPMLHVSKDPESA